jgi:hypothetical protein
VIPQYPFYSGAFQAAYTEQLVSCAWFGLQKYTVHPPLTKSIGFQSHFTIMDFFSFFYNGFLFIIGFLKEKPMMSPGEITSSLTDASAFLLHYYQVQHLQKEHIAQTFTGSVEETFNSRLKKLGK